MVTETKAQQSTATQVQKSKDLKSQVDLLAKYGGFDLLEMSIEGSQNLNPNRKARKQIFLNETSKKSDREELKKSLEMWKNILENKDSLTDMVAECEDNYQVSKQIECIV